MRKEHSVARGSGSGVGPDERGVSPDERGVAPAVGKTLEIGIVVLFVGFLTTSLLAGVVPDYRTAAGVEVADRVLVSVGQETERSIPPAASDVSSQRTITIPTTIAGSGYSLDVDGRTLVLDHPDPAVSDSLRLSLPPRVDRIDGNAQSGGAIVVTIRGDSSGLIVELDNEGER